MQPPTDHRPPTPVGLEQLLYLRIGTYHGARARALAILDPTTCLSPSPSLTLSLIVARAHAHTSPLASIGQDYIRGAHFLSLLFV